MAHKSQKLQFEFVAVLGLISLFTHMHIFWVAGLLLALIDLPDFGTPLRSIADSVETHCRRHAGRAPAEAGARSRLHPGRTFRSSKDARAGKGCATMLELMLCSLVTIVPDYLYRRYRQGKRFGKEITFFSVWYELRWGITGCLMLTIGADHDDLLFPSLDHLRGALLPHGADPARRRPAASPRSMSASARR